MKLTPWFPPDAERMKEVTNDDMDPAGAGMTLRDYFAAQAMQADMTDGIHESDFARTALRAYRMADVMMEARKK
jgi:hypothetical protein